MATGTLPTFTEPNTIKYMMSSWIMVGVPRMTVRYSLHSAFRMRRWPVWSWVVRMYAMMKPSTTPSAAAAKATVRVVLRPFRNSRYRCSVMKVAVNSLTSSAHRFWKNAMGFPPCGADGVDEADIHKKLNFYAYMHKEKGQSRHRTCSVLCISYQTTKAAICKEGFSNLSRPAASGRESRPLVYFRTMMF